MEDIGKSITFVTKKQKNILLTIKILHYENKIHFRNNFRKTHNKCNQRSEKSRNSSRYNDPTNTGRISKTIEQAKMLAELKTKGKFYITYLKKIEDVE